MYNYGFQYPAQNMNKFGQAATAFSAFVNHLSELKRQREDQNLRSLEIAARNPNFELQAAPNAQRRGFLHRMFGNEYGNQNGQPVAEIGGTPFTAVQRPTIAQMFPAITSQRYAQLAPIYQDMIATEAAQQEVRRGMQGIDERELEAEAKKKQSDLDFERQKALLKLRIEGHERIAKAKGGRTTKESETARGYIERIRALQEKRTKGSEGRADPYEVYVKGLKAGEKPRSKEDYATDMLMEQREIESLEAYNARKGHEATSDQLMIMYAQKAVSLDPSVRDEMEELLNKMGYSLGKVSDEMEDELELDPESEEDMPKILNVREKK